MLWRLAVCGYMCNGSWLYVQWELVICVMGVGYMCYEDCEDGYMCYGCWLYVAICVMGVGFM